MELRWENFGVKAQTSTDSLVQLSLPHTTSLRDLMQLSECGAVDQLACKAANMINYTAGRIFEDWELLLQADLPTRRSGAATPLDVAWLHNLAKGESVPDFVIDSERRYLSYSFSFNGEAASDLRRIAQGLEVRGAAASFEIGLNLLHLQLTLLRHRGRLLFRRAEQCEEVPEL